MTALPDPPQDLASIENTEAALTLPSFTADTAWELGTTLRTRLLALSPNAAIVNIALANNSQVLFHCVTRANAGAAPDNDVWVARKRAAVLRWGHSTWWLRRKFDGDEAAFAARMSLSGGRAGEYAMHGGGFPVRVRGVEGVVGVVVVSGLKQEQDHQVIVEVLKEYLGQ